MLGSVILPERFANGYKCVNVFEHVQKVYDISTGALRKRICKRVLKKVVESFQEEYLSLQITRHK